MTHMQVERAGMHSLFQDLGRIGHQKLGVAVNGPMDEWSHRLANALVGNPEDAAVLECTLSGPRVRFSGDAVVALCGAAMPATVDGQPMPAGCAVYLRRGAVLDIGHRSAGARAYLAVRGGFALPRVLGSRSTNLRAGFGGMAGRALAKGDQVPLAAVDPALPQPRVERYGVQSGLAMVAGPRVAPVAAPATGDTVRFVPGPHWAAFTPAAQTLFCTAAYTVSPQSNRMGARLQGPALSLRQALEPVSEATVFGTVQVPADGQPIVLMADRESAGGYPKIGYVASADLPTLAQRVAGDALRFVPVAQHEAEALWRSFAQELAGVCAAATAALTAGPSPDRPAPAPV